MWNLRNKTNKQRRVREREREAKKQTLNYKELIVTRGEVSGGIGEIGDED